MDERDFMFSMVDNIVVVIGYSQRARIIGIVQSKYKMKVEYVRYVWWVFFQLKVQIFRYGVCGF